MSGAEVARVDVVLVSLRVGNATLARADRLLDPSERAAAGARGAEGRRRYLVAHAAARIVLGEHLGMHPASVAIGIEARGRPVVSGISFSLSHSGERAAIAVAPPDVCVGVDLERVRDRPRLDALARRAFEPAEHRRWRALPPEAQPRAFAQRWTDLEALLKARGTGIAGGLTSAFVPPAGWSRTVLDPGAGYVGALATNRPAIEWAQRVLNLPAVLRGRGAQRS